MTINALQQRLQSLSPTRLEIKDDSAAHAGHTGNRGGGHYVVTVESSHFTGKSTIIRHRMVYQAVGDLMPSRVHALSINAIAPDDHH